MTEFLAAEAAIRQLHDKIKPNKVTVPPVPFDEALAKAIESIQR